MGSYELPIGFSHENRELTNESEKMPREITDTVDISSHEGHDLCLGREIIYGWRFSSPFEGWSVLFAILVPRCVTRPSRSDILSDQSLGK